MKNVTKRTELYSNYATIKIKNQGFQRSEKLTIIDESLFEEEKEDDNNDNNNNDIISLTFCHV